MVATSALVMRPARELTKWQVDGMGTHDYYE
jgi:hypothetical protein